MKKILITGIDGFIGKYLSKKLKDKYDVYGIDLKQSSYDDILKINYLEVIFKNIKPDYVIHLAAQSLLRRSINNPIFDAQTNIIGSLNVLEMCKKYDVKKIIYASTGGARYGEYSNTVNETFQPMPISPYGISKHTVEHYLQYYYRQFGLDYLALCFANVYGPEDNIENNRIITTLISNIINDREMNINGDGTQLRDFIYIDDLVECISDNIEKDTEHKLFNLCYGQSYSINFLIGLIQTIAYKKLKVKYNNSILGELNNVYLDCSLAKKELNWNPKISIAEGVSKIYEAEFNRYNIYNTSSN